VLRGHVFNTGRYATIQNWDFQRLTEGASVGQNSLDQITDQSNDFKFHESN